MSTAILADVPGPLPGAELAGSVLTWSGTAWELSGGGELDISLDDLSDVDGTTGTGGTVVLSAGPYLTEPRVVGSINDEAGLKIIALNVVATPTRWLVVTNALGLGAVRLDAYDGASLADMTIGADDLLLSATTAKVNGNTIETQNNKAAASGYCDLDSSALVPVARLPVSDMAFVDSPVQTGRVIQLIKEQNTTNLISIGIAAPTETLAGISADGDNFAIKRYLTAATTNSTAGLITPVLFRIGYNVDTLFVVTSGSVITSYRQWVGLTNTTLGLVATPTTQHVAAISYDSARDGTVFWRTVTCNGTSATVTATSVAIAASTFYTVRIVTTPTTVAFYINGALTNTHTATLPGNATNLTMEACVTTLTTATRRFEFSRFGALIP